MTLNTNFGSLIVCATALLCSSTLHAQAQQNQQANRLNPQAFSKMTTNSALPLFYKSIELVDSQKHKNWGISTQQSNFSFSKDTNLIPLVVSEVNFALRNYPILFIQEPGVEAPTLVALVGNGNGQNQFVDSKGQWRAGTYVPAWVRLYPFAMVRDPANNNAALAFDPQSNLFTQKGAAKLIDAEGKSTETLERLLAFQREYFANMDATSQMSKALKEAGVLEPAGISFKIPNVDQPKSLQGFMIVNEVKLRALNPEALHKLSQANALGLAFAQILSMPSIQNITPPQ